MTTFKMFLSLCLLFQLISAQTETEPEYSSLNQPDARVLAEETEPLFGCVYTCTRTGTATDASSICSATHVTLSL